ncbi:MAG: hypothetical protein ACRDQ7_08915 [Haloechinothrix sp.]
MLDEVARRADWGKRMPSGFAQGVGFHDEGNTLTACVVDSTAGTQKRPGSRS